MESFCFEKKDVSQDILEVSLQGKVKTTDIPSFQELFQEIVAGKQKQIILDFSQLTFLNSKAVGIILRTLGAIRKTGGEMVALNVNDQVLQVFQFLTLDKLMKIFLSLEEAQAHFEKSS